MSKRNVGEFAMKRSEAHITTERASSYLQQLW